MKSRTKVLWLPHSCIHCFLTDAEGYEVMHDYALITVFSASRYGGTRSNYGAFLVFNDARSLIPQFHRFKADDLLALTRGAYPPALCCIAYLP